MGRPGPWPLVALSAALSASAAFLVSARWWWAAAPALALTCAGVGDLLWRRRSARRGHPSAGRLGRPAGWPPPGAVREPRPDAWEEPEFLVPSLWPVEAAQEPPVVRVGGPDCSQPYDMALLNVSAMSFGALSGRAVLALNRGAALGRFAQDTGEGGLSEHHLRGGGDLVWELGTGYFGCRADDGGLDWREFADKAALPEVRCVSLKLSQGAAPGTGAVLPAVKVSAEIARERGVPRGVDVVSPPSHRMFSTPRELVLFVARLREAAGGKPVGLKLCVGARSEFLALCRAMLAEGVAPDFVVVDGAEGGTGAPPPASAGRLGMPLTQGLVTVHNALTGVGLRDRIRIGASGRVATGRDVVTRLIQGADYTNAARAMMLAVGCVRAGRCHTGGCPSGVATQDPLRARALHVARRARQVERYQRETVRDAVRIMAAMGVREPGGLTPAHLVRRVAPGVERSYADLHEWLAPGELLAGPPPSWEADWKAADPDGFD
ncbi:glutamate synthase-related protein [Streptomyces hilarionis]|uniref:glutamate synthase-related protein n=1 Tax=Streptomyces hilarionis TaxID=2839954 RepID=UPI00211A4122|nr:FMN-binding glutamate synthase family protein [Streptomyces hilarionis]MCQ9130417.1 FMN-binding glutamate synthase family protein [Streptomyces hilarionis]